MGEAWTTMDVLCHRPRCIAAWEPPGLTSCEGPVVDCDHNEVEALGDNSQDGWGGMKSQRWTLNLRKTKITANNDYTDGTASNNDYTDGAA